MRYFVEVAYKGTNYSGFQIQKNANTIQAEIEKAFKVLFKQSIDLTGSSRTDAGVHAEQNFFHFDINSNIGSEEILFPYDFNSINSRKKFLYNLNSILPDDIVCKNLIRVSNESHCRFDAISREYKYVIYRFKDPFLVDRGYYYPYKIDKEILNTAAQLIKETLDFSSFSKKNTQVKTFECIILESKWHFGENEMIYKVKANRFLRGMVRALTATMLKTARGSMTINDFKQIINTGDPSKAFFSVPPQGLFLESVKYPEDYFIE